MYKTLYVNVTFQAKMLTLVCLVYASLNLLPLKLTMKQMDIRYCYRKPVYLRQTTHYVNICPEQKDKLS